MAVEAARRALRTTGAVPDVAAVRRRSRRPTPTGPTRPSSTPRCACRTPRPRSTLGLSPRSAIGALLLGLRSTGTSLIAAADVRGGLAGSADEANGGDAAAAFVVGDDDPDAPVVAEVVATASRTAEFVDRWRSPGETRSKTWDDKFAEVTYAQLGADAWNAALDAAGVVRRRRSPRSPWPGRPPRIAGTVAAKLGPRVVDDLAATVGNTGAAQPAAAARRAARAGRARQGAVPRRPRQPRRRRRRRRAAHDRSAVDLSTGTDGRRAGRPAARASRYGRFLAWRGNLGGRAAAPTRAGARLGHGRRPQQPTGSSASSAAATVETGHGQACRRRRVGRRRRTDAMDPADGRRRGTIATFTVDRVAYSPSPPIVFAVVDFDGGGRLPIELTDCARRRRVRCGRDRSGSR